MGSCLSRINGYKGEVDNKNYKLDERQFTN